MKNLTKIALLVLAVWVMGMAQDVAQAVAPPSVVFEALALDHDIGTKKKPKYRSPTALVPSPDGKIMYIAEQTAKKIAVYNLETKLVDRRINLPNEVTGIALTADGGTIYATCGSEIWPAGMVCVVNVATGRVTKVISDKIGHYPRAPVLTPDGAKLYVCNMFSNNLSVISTATQEVIKVVELIREPYAAAITADGKRLIIGNSLPNDLSTDSEFVSCQVTIYNTETDDTLKNLRLTRGSHSVFGVAVSPDGKYAFATHLIGKFNLLGSTVTGGWLHTNNVAVIDIDKMKFLNDVSLDYANQGMANPWDIKFATDSFPADSTYMIIAHAGGNRVSIIHYQAFIKTVLEETANGIDMQRNFGYLLDDVRKTVDIDSKGTRALAVIGRSLFTAGYFDDENAHMEEHRITLSTKRTEVPAPVIHTIGVPVPKNGERQGEQNYYDAGLCQQEWQSCHSCHPLTRPDALNWILNSGVAGTPKNAKSMLYAWWTPPTTWTGRREHAQNSIIAGIELELFQQSRTELTVPMDTFFMYMKPMPSPFLVKGRLSEAAQRGRALYYDKEKVDCIICHKGPLFYDDKLYHVGIQDLADANNMNTPSLVEVWRTAPYGHLGSVSLGEILSLDPHSNMAKKLRDGALTRKDVNDLIEYIESL